MRCMRLFRAALVDGVFTDFTVTVAWLKRNPRHRAPVG